MEPHADTAAFERVLVVVAHPDDVEYGMAGTVARWVEEGKTVSYVLVTRGEAGNEDAALTAEQAGALREREQRAAAAAVGVTDLRFLGWPDDAVYYGPDLRRAIAREIRRVRPEVVATDQGTLFWGGRVVNHADHRATTEATIDAILDASLRHAFPELLAEGFEPWRRVKRLYLCGDPEADVAVDVTATLPKAIAALQAHASYVGDMDCAAYLRDQTAQNGVLWGIPHAELFRVIRYA
ncbi:MAG TPA: PIG-L deacetylase family protein [Chloroflexota bacterium]|nr:PIG-L deacetylase family protein [Chloroflexota bacterium]